MKKLILFVLALVCVLGLAGCSGNMAFDGMALHIGEAAKITIKTDPAGREVNIADREFIQSITANINSLSFEKSTAVDGKADYAYMLTWFDAKNNQIMSITITEENGHQIIYNGHHYRVSADLAIDTELIQKMLDAAA